MTINSLLVYDNVLAADGKKRQLNLPDFQTEYKGIGISGTNIYWGLQGDNLTLGKGVGLQDAARAFLQTFVDAIPPNGVGTVDYGLQPNEDLVGDAAYEDVLNRLDKIEDLAKDLNGFQQGLTDGRKLRIVVRFASEMNTGANNKWSGVPDSFKKAWEKVYGTFKGVSEEFVMNFAPFVYVDSVVDGPGSDAISNYWPGVNLVDIVGCTWYAGSGNAVRPAKDNLDAYFGAFAGTGLPYAVSEMCGCCDRKTGRGKADVVQSMFWHLINFDSKQPLNHVTFFLTDDWTPGKVDLGAVIGNPPKQADPCSALP